MGDRQSSLEEEPDDGMDMGLLRGETAGSWGDFALTLLILNTERISRVLRRNKPAPYVRRAAWIHDIEALLQDHKQERPLHILKLLRRVPHSVY